MENSSEIYKPPEGQGVNIEYLVAEIVAFPLSSVSAFENPVIDLSPDLENKNMRKIWRDTETHMVQAVPDISIDMVLAIRDQFWFGKKNDRTAVYEYLKWVAKEFLEVRGSVAVPKVVGNREKNWKKNLISTASRRNSTLRWFSFSLPMDLFLGAFGDSNPPLTIDYLSPQLMRNLKDKGFAETHLHIGAALEFPEFWVTTLDRLADKGLKDDVFKSAGAELNEGEDLAPWLLRAAMVRCILARFLFARKHKGDDFHKWLNNVFFVELLNRHGAGVLEQIRLAIKELWAGKRAEASPDSPWLRIIYREYGWNGNPPELCDRPEHLYQHDPISFLVKNGPGTMPSPEIQFISRGISYLEKTDKDLLFASLFWQVVRVRCIYYRHVTQRPMTPGLLWFIRHYGRNKPGREKVGTRLMIRGAARTCGFGEGLRSLEVRNIPEDSVSETLKLLEETVSSFKVQSLSRPSLLFEFGWVFHFAKVRGKNTLKGFSKSQWKDTNADPEPSEREWKNRYARYYRGQRKKTLILARTIFNFPGTIRVLRGLDVCTDELGVPSWVFLPLFRYLEEAGKAASRYLKTRFGEDVPPLGKTLHTGEDFVHLLGGLRRVDEAVCYFNLGPGDRIGHGMALGTNPVIWAGKKKRIAMKREDRLFDLTWEWSKYSNHLIPCSTSRIAYIEREISRLSYDMFSKTCLPHIMEQFIRDLHDENSLRKINYPDCKLCDEFNKEKEKCRRCKLLHDYLSSKLIFKKGHETEWIDLIPEIEPMVNLQNHIRKIIASLGIVVEVNPTSNLLIGNLTDLKNHPFWRLNSPTGDNDVAPVALCIGSDDPLTFATNLRWEYVLIYESLVEGGLSASQAWDWVNMIRETGMNSRFTLPLEDNHRDIYLDGDKYRFFHALDLDRNIRNMPYLDTGYQID